MSCPRASGEPCRCRRRRRRLRWRAALHSRHRCSSTRLPPERWRTLALSVGNLAWRPPHGDRRSARGSPVSADRTSRDDSLRRGSSYRPRAQERRDAARSAGVGVAGSSSAARSAGSRARQSAVAVIASKPRARPNSESSVHGAPMSWRPTGRPSDKPAGMRDAGQPGHVDRQGAGVREVHRDRVGEARARIGNATVGEVGATSASKPLCPERVEIALDEGPDLLGLEVVGVVVAGRERVGPEHDPALDLGAETLAAGREVDRRARRRPHPAAARTGSRRSGPGSRRPRPGPRCSTWRGRSRCAAG